MKMCNESLQGQSYFLSVMEIGLHMMAGDVVEAELVALNDSYQLGHAGFDNIEPNYLVFYPELREKWNEGYFLGMSSYEVIECNWCQNEDLELCPIHDYE
jgi:hypothetical protein